DDVAERSKCFNRILRVIIIPRDTIIIEECEKLVMVLFKTLFIFDYYFTLIISTGQFFVETLNKDLMLSQEMTLQSELINCFNYGFQQHCKMLYEFFQLFVKRILENRVSKSAFVR